MVKRIDVGGYRLAVQMTGSGAPPVVCLSSLGNDGEEWAAVVPQLEQLTTCITYARPGIADSDDLPAGEVEQLRSAQWAAEQLRALLQQLEVSPPFVFATGSIGAYIADRFAETWPEEVAGMVLVDPTNPTPMPPQFDEDRRLVDGGDSGARIRMGDWQDELARPRGGHRIRTVVLSSSVGRWRTADPEHWAPMTLDEVDVEWQRQQREWVARWSATHVVADTAGHHVYRDQPMLVAAVVAAMVQAAHEGADAVHLDPAALVGAGGHLAAEVQDPT